MFVAPLGVAILSGVVLLMIDQEPEVLPATAQLEVVDMTVGGGGGEADDLPYLDIRVRNTGETVSVVTGATLEIGAQGVIEICEGGGAPLEESAEYDVIMPALAVGENRVVEADVSQQIAPHEADRFSIRLTIPETEFFWHPHLYEVDVHLSHDGSVVPIEAGTAIVAVPLVPSRQYFAPEMSGVVDESISECYRENRRLLTQFIEMDGIKPPGLNRDLTLGDVGGIPTSVATPESSTVPDVSSAAAESPSQSNSAPITDSPVLASSLEDFQRYLVANDASCEPPEEEVTTCESAAYTVFLIADDARPQDADQVIAMLDEPTASPPLVLEGLALLATRDPAAITWVQLAELPPDGLLHTWFGNTSMLLYGSSGEFQGLHISAELPD